MSEQTKYLLSESDMPKTWYNIQADFETPLPPVINPGTGQPVGPEDFAPIFPMELIMQEVGVGPYALLERLGKGGMGSVYKAVHRETGAVVAVKILKAELREPYWKGRSRNMA